MRVERLRRARPGAVVRQEDLQGLPQHPVPERPQDPRPEHRPHLRRDPRHQLRECVHLLDGAHRRRLVRRARRRKDRSRFLLAVSGGDGHHAVLAWAELDVDFGDSPVLLATRLDGEELDEAGAQMVVPSDRCGARYVSAVTHVWFGALATPGI
ncbi:hypothetical protein OG756_33310 [Streptomyces sp. NBC_01310]|uniref:hypothetical protein n=1 Tax=Streptomyces sp. NBC_01310 TaxID=2903820 RepID=UPI0035B62771|nr:hypothetical protein OG756_33310 [Streptomyces sp. NBC_01310]